MTRIFKYELSFTKIQRVMIPSTKILSVKSQRDDIVVYAMVENEDVEVMHEFVVIGTGHGIIFDTDKFEFLDTVAFNNELYIFHVFHRIVD